MNHDAFRRALLAFTRRAPFIPFVIEFTTGESLRVTHPEAAMVRGDLVVFTHRSGKQRLFDGCSVCQLMDDDKETLDLSNDE